MSSSKHLKTPGPRPRSSFLTTYRSDYKPFTERPLQVDQLNPRPKPKPEPPVITPPKIDSDTWAVFRRYCYRTTNSAYGSSTFTQMGKPLVVTLLEANSDLQGDKGASVSVLPVPGASSLGTTQPQSPSLKPKDVKQASSSSSSSSSVAPSSPSVSKPPSRSLRPASSPPSGVLAPSISTGVSSPAPGEAGTPEVTVAKEAVPVTGKETTGEEKGPLPYVGGGEGSVLEQREAGEEPQQKVEGHQEKVPVYDGDFLGSLCRAARLERILNHHQASTAIITNKDAQSGDTTPYKKALRQTIGLQKSAFPKPDLKQRECRAWKTEYAENYGLVAQAFPRHVPRAGTLPLALSQANIHYSVPSGKTLLSEYQASYTFKICPTHMRKLAE